MEIFPSITHTLPFMNDFTTTQTTVLLFSSFIFLLLIKKAIWKRSKSPDEKNLPPSPRKLSVIGHLHHLLGHGLPHKAFMKLEKKYGPIFHLQLGQVSTVVISSQEHAKEVLKHQDPACAGRPDSIATKIIFYDYSDIVFSPYNERWRQFRRICILELLSAKNVKSFARIREEEASRLMNKIRSLSETTVDLTDMIERFSSSNTSRVVFGKVTKDRETLTKMMKAAVELASGFELLDFFPTFKLLHKVSWNMFRLSKISSQTDTILDGIVEEHRVRQSGEYGGEDIVDVLLRNQKDKELEFPVTNENIKAIIFDMFSGGTDTSFKAMDWTMAELMRNPHVMAKVQGEIREALKGKETVEDSDIRGLKYFKSVIKESFRLHPPVPLLPRACRAECKVDGYTIPIKSKVFVNVYSMGRNPKYWHQPEIFLPERFLESSVDFLGNNYEFLPFGAGKRICPGLNFAQANIELLLAQLLYHFDWKLPQGMTPADVDMTERHGISVPRKQHLFLVPTVYNPSN